jgi:hypothetical protein
MYVDVHGNSDWQYHLSFSLTLVRGYLSLAKLQQNVYELFNILIDLRIQQRIPRLLRDIF